MGNPEDFGDRLNYGIIHQAPISIFYLKGKLCIYGAFYCDVNYTEVISFFDHDIFKNLTKKIF